MDGDFLWRDKREDFLNAITLGINSYADIPLIVKKIVDFDAFRRWPERRIGLFGRIFCVMLIFFASCAGGMWDSGMGYLGGLERVPVLIVGMSALVATALFQSDRFIEPKLIIDTLFVFGGICVLTGFSGVLSITLSLAIVVITVFRNELIKIYFAKRGGATMKAWNSFFNRRHKG